MKVQPAKAISQALTLYSLDNIYLIITKIRQAFSAPSISCDVMYNSETIFLYDDGLADVKSNLKPDEDTVYVIASCTKGFITALCDILVEKGKLS